MSAPLGQCLDGPYTTAFARPENPGFRASPHSVSYPTLAVLQALDIRDVAAVEAVYAYAWVARRYFAAVHRLPFGERLPEAIYRDGEIAFTRLRETLGEETAADVAGRLHENHQRATEWCVREAGR